MKQFIKENWILILSLIYIISPLDFIPDYITGPLGIIDDGALVFALMGRAIYKSWRKNQDLKKGIDSKEVSKS